VWALALACWRKRRRRIGPTEVGVRVIGAESRPPRPVAPQPAPSPPPDDTLERIFDVPDEKFVPRRPEFVPDQADAAVIDGVAGPDELVAASTTTLERRARMLRVSISAWDRGRDEASAAVGRAELRALEGEIRRRQS
jgi:hypothetical protein